MEWMFCWQRRWHNYRFCNRFNVANGWRWSNKRLGRGLKLRWVLELGGYDDWRLPNVKELQSIVDYTKSPETTGTPAIDDLFVLSEIIDPDGEENYGFYWTSTTHQDGRNTADSASYVAFGEAQGQMNGRLMDVHGAGSVRSDPKSGDASQYPDYFGPQGDVRYVYNYVLAVRINKILSLIIKKEPIHYKMNGFFVLHVRFEAFRYFTIHTNTNFKFTSRLSEIFSSFFNQSQISSGVIIYRFRSPSR